MPARTRARVRSRRRAAPIWRSSSVLLALRFGAPDRAATSPGWDAQRRATGSRAAARGRPRRPPAARAAAGRGDGVAGRASGARGKSWDDDGARRPSGSRRAPAQGQRRSTDAAGERERHRPPAAVAEDAVEALRMAVREHPLEQLLARVEGEQRGGDQSAGAGSRAGSRRRGASARHSPAPSAPGARQPGEEEPDDDRHRHRDRRRQRAQVLVPLLLQLLAGSSRRRRAGSAAGGR